MPTTTSSGPNLTFVSYLGRQTVKFGLVAIVLLIVGRTLFSAFVAYWRAAHPTPPPPPTMGFGPLPNIAFPDQLTEDKPVSYLLETPTGTTPSFGDRAKVFFMPKTTPSLLNDEQARSKAADLGFVFEPSVLDEKTYRWSKSKPLESSLEMNIQTNAFTFTTDFLSRPELIRSAPVPDTFEAVSQVKSFLSRANLLAPDVATAAGTTTFLKVVGGELEEAVAFSDADFIRVDLQRIPIDTRFQTFTPKGEQGVIRAVVTGVFNNYDSIVEMEYAYHPVEPDQVETYPLRSSQSAWKILQAGEGYIASKGSGDQAVIRKVELGYYDSFEEQSYLQPIYVFSGDDGFLGYVSALDPVVFQSSQNDLQ